MIKSVKTKLGNEIELVGDPMGKVLVIGVFHGDEPQGKYLIERYLSPSSKSKISVLPQGEDMTRLAQNLRHRMTREEVILWQNIRGKQIENAKFRRQQKIGKYICDFVCFEKKLIIELDGSQHNEKRGIEADKLRDEFLKSQGFRILRFWNNDINNNLSGVLEKIQETLCPPLVGGPEFTIPRRGLLFIPCLNPDGMAQNTRTNANGVDLNRNFPTKNWQLSEKNNYFGGGTPASEIETRFVIDIIQEFKPELILTLHTPYKIVNYDGDAKEIAQKISEIINYPIESDIGYPTPGSFGTYCGIERNIPTVTLELDEECPIEDLIKPVHKIFDTLQI